MRVSVGEMVLYQGNEYKIIHVYPSNYCEVRKEGTFRIILVHADDVQLLSK